MSEFWCVCTLCCLLALIVLYGFFEIHYFLRMCLCVAMARCCKRKCHILETTTVSGVCLTNDVDTLLYHMNNARYLRECDFARVDFYERTQLYRTIRAKGGSVYQGAATIRYRRFIRPFHRFTITSRIIYWDDSSVFMEHRFVRPSDQFVHSIAICRQRIIDCSAEEVMTELLMTPKYAATAMCTQPPTGMTSSTMHLQASQQSILSGTSQADGTQLQLENGQLQATHMPAPAAVDEAAVGAAATTPTPTVTTMTQIRMKPTPPPEVLKWIEYNDLSSKNLRKVC